MIAGQAAHYLGWRGALYVPATFLAAAAVIMLLFLEESPPDDAGPDAEENPRESLQDSPGGSLTENLFLTLTNPSLWLLGLSLGLLNACRYGFIDWGLTHLKEVQETGVQRAALKYAVLPIGAVAGSFLAGWATDRFFKGRRAPVICALLLLLGILSLGYDAVARISVEGTLVLLVCIGFCIYGPQVLLVGTAPADLARRGTSAAAAGFVNFMGYMGAASGDVVTGQILESSNDWQVAIYFWAGCAFVAALTSAILWNATAHRDTG